MEIVENRALRIRTRTPEKYGVIPKHHVTEVDGGYEVLVHWGLDECRVLNNLGVKDVPYHIGRSYGWPGKYKPMDHQRETAGFVTMYRRSFILNEAGTAKTISALWAADYLMSIKRVRRCLIVCPLSIMHSAWMGDLNKSVIHRSAIVAHHTQASRRVDMIKGDYEFVIINYDGLNLVADDVKKDGRFDLVIVDEATSYSTATTRRWKSLAKILTPDTLLWMMTGTPSAQSPLHAYGMAKLVNPAGVPAYFSAWRDKVMNKITTFKWAPKPDAKDQVFKALQPAIRFTKEQCLDLPPVLKQTREVEMTAQQWKYYKLIKDQMLAMAAGETITAVNKATVVSKLLQISCIGYDTEVLTHEGWKAIQRISLCDTLWDGVEWVAHAGVVHKGVQPVVICGGVCMTADHLVLTTQGWLTAEETNDGESSKRLSRAGVRVPYGFGTCRDERREDQESPVVVPVCLRKQGGTGEPVPSHALAHAPAQLWVPPWKRDAQDVLWASLPDLDAHEKALHRPHVQGLQKLWSAGHKSLRSVGDFFQRFLGRHGRGVLTSTDLGADEKQRQLHPQELPVGDSGAAVQQHTQQCVYRNTVGHPDSGAGGAQDGHEQRYFATATEQRLALGDSVDGASHTGVPQEVFDILNCGPRNRFTVRGNGGEITIVHNCGAVYTDDKDVVEFDATPRMNILLEVLEETERKVIIFALFRSSIATITAFLTKHGHAVEEIHGGVPATKRGDIVNRFQNTKNPRVLVMQPQATAHGLTLTAADTVVFFGPLMSVEQYVQCIARADRQGQTSGKVTVIHIQGSPIEKKMFDAMDAKVEEHAVLTQMFDFEMKGA